MWEVLFLFTAIILAILLTLSEKNPLRRAVVTFPFFVQTVFKQASFNLNFTKILRIFQKLRKKEISEKSYGYALTPNGRL